MKRLPALTPVIAAVPLCAALLLHSQAVFAADMALVVPPLGEVEANVLYTETFDDPDAWETYLDPMGISFGVEAGAYRAYAMGEGYVWGLNNQVHTDAVIEVETTPMTMNFENGFGVMCRADEANNGDGYYFMINANGYYSIGKGDGDSIVSLIDWTESPAIHQQLDVNTVRAVCVGDVLAMYINDEFVAQVEDSSYSEGFAGLAVAGASFGDVDVMFDNLVFYEVSTP